VSSTGLWCSSLTYCENTLHIFQFVFALQLGQEALTVQLSYALHYPSKRQGLKVSLSYLIHTKLHEYTRNVFTLNIINFSNIYTRSDTKGTESTTTNAGNNDGI
jgi:hypothetical protein